MRKLKLKCSLVVFAVMCLLMPFTLGADADETVVTEDRTIVLQIGLPHYLLDQGDGVWQTCQMDVAPYITDKRTYVPVRYLAEGLGIPNRKPYID